MTIRPSFWDRLAREIEGDAAGDLFTRGRYSTDASMYQCFPAGVVCPKSEGDLAIALEMAREEGLAVIARGGGTSTAGQALGEGMVADFSKYLNRVTEIDADGLTCWAEPGCTPAGLNAALKPYGLVFPVDIASSRQATIGGMLGNNSAGLRALRYGSMRDNTASVDALLADGHRVVFNRVSEEETAPPSAGRDRLLDLLQFGEQNEKAIATLWPLRAPGTPEPEGYDLRTLLASSADHNLARLIAGSEGTLALAARVELKLVRKPANRALGICRFGDLRTALRFVPKVMMLDPSAVELLDRTLLEFLAAKAEAGAQAARLLQGDPAAILIVEFDDGNPVANTRSLKALGEYAEGAGGESNIIEVLGENARASLWRLRREALTRAWALKSAAQPLAFLDDGAVPVQNLADYGADLEALLGKYGVRAALHGQAGQGCLQVRPILNLRHEQDRKRMRELSDGLAALLQRYGGVLTGGHGIGLARSEALERRLGPEAIKLFAELKGQLDPGYMLNPGKILKAPAFDDAAMLRAPREAKPEANAPIALAWGSAPSAGRVLDHARRCNGLALCRASEPRFTCPSFAVTKDERDSPRGRANSLRLSLSGQLGDHALSSAAMAETLELCVSCKACKSACPFGIDIPKMKAEALAAAWAEGNVPRALSLYGRLPEYTDRARKWRAVLALRDVLPGMAQRTERTLGFTADRPWPKWAGRRFRAPHSAKPGRLGTVALFADTFNRSFEPANLRAAAHVLKVAGYAVIAFALDGQERALCCGRTYYDAGNIEKAREEAIRMLTAIDTFHDRGIPVVGLEPACALMMRDEYEALGLPVRDKPAILLFEEFLSVKLAEKKVRLPLTSIEAELVFHPHCHERALGLEETASSVLKLVPGLTVNTVQPGCCGLNGFVGMTPATLEPSLAMAELGLFPAIRKAGRDAFIAATGFSCRKQIHDGLGQTARHPAAILDLALRGNAEIVS